MNLGEFISCNIHCNVFTFSITLDNYKLSSDNSSNRLKWSKLTITRETINVSTIAVIHYFSKWASYWHLWLIPNILQWQDCKIFTELVPLHTASRSSHQRFSVKKVFLKICEISLETLLKRACNFIKKRLQHSCFPVLYLRNL